MVITPIVGVYIPIIRIPIPIKGGMNIPNIATFHHGTHDLSKGVETKMCLDSKPGEIASTRYLVWSGILRSASLVVYPFSYIQVHVYIYIYPGFAICVP